ncbi:MAG: carbohydrate binding family 9 domain-containing protein [Candidatus Kryptonium sp.]|nr:carbohydrate binding family 9 domain-containing protein [Candidatus Kryptonium sp.]
MKAKKIKIGSKVSKKRILIDLVLIFFVLALSDISMGHNSQNKTAVAVKVEGGIKIDGVLSEAAWGKAISVSDFIQLDPYEGESPTERTEVKILYDDRAIYFGFILYDSEPSKITARLTRRDREIESDKINIILDTFHDHKTAYFFSVNSAGVKVDGIITGDGSRFDNEWDGIWEAEVQINENGWICEVEIPFATLRFAADREWGINFERYISRKKELVQWALISKRETGRVSRIGHLVGLNQIGSPKGIEIYPYAASKLVFSPESELNSKTRDFRLDVGLDLRYKITNDFVLNATFNPDFSQVEADQVVLNLTTYETFYPEKRQFFTDGSQFFSFGAPGGRGGGRRFAGMQIFYSRRIGKRPSGYPNVPEGGRIVYYPERTKILSAIKLTGKSQNGISLGFINALTSPEKAIVSDSLGREFKVRVEPLANYAVLRLQKDILRNSMIGMILTNVSRDGTIPALTGGFDWGLRFLNNTYAFEGFLAFSKTSRNQGKPATSGRISIAKIAGENFLYSTNYDYTAKGFYINDVGFFTRDNDHGGSTELRFKQDIKPFWIIRRYYAGIRYNYRWNFDRAMIMRGIGFDQTIEFLNYWGFSIFGFYSPWKVYDDRETRGNGLYLGRERYVVNFSVRSDSRKNIVVDFEYGFGEWGFLEKEDVRRWQDRYEVSVTLRPADWIDFQIENQLRFVRNEEAWVENISVAGKRLSIFADRSTDEFDLTLRGTVTFTRDLTFQIYAQTFIAKGHYKNFKVLQTPEILVPYNYTKNPDFNTQSFNLNFILRWEYKAGSVLYFVITQSRNGRDGDYFRSLHRDIMQTFKTPAVSGVYLKLTHGLII